MLRWLLILGALAGVAWYGARMLRARQSQAREPALGTDPAAAGGTDQPRAGSLTEQVTQSVSQAATAARQAAASAVDTVRAAVPVGGSAADRTFRKATAAAAREPEPEEPREAHAAELAAMPAVQAPAILPEP